MPFFEAIRLALQTIRAQKLKSAFSIIGVFIGVMFLIAVVSVVQGMNRYMTDKFAGTILGVNTFRLRQFPDVQPGNITDSTARSGRRGPDRPRGQDLSAPLPGDRGRGEAGQPVRAVARQIRGGAGERAAQALRQSAARGGRTGGEGQLAARNARGNGAG